MRKLILSLAAVAMVATSCTQDEVIGGSADNTKIGFTAYATSTRADMNTDLFNVENNQFGVTGYYGTAVYLGKNAQQKHDGRTWEYADPSELRYWPTASGATMDFYAYYPFAATATFADALAAGAEAMSITGWTDGADVMYAVANDKTYQARTPLIFKHALSKIKEVNVTSSLPGLTVNITGIEFTGTAIAGTVSVKKDGTATVAESSPAVARAYTGLDATPTATAVNLLADKDAYIVPELTASEFWKEAPTAAASQSVVEGKITIKLTGTVKQGDVTVYSGDMYIPTSIDSWVAAKRYIYNINFKNGVGYKENGDPILKPILFSATVSDWTDEATITIDL